MWEFNIADETDSRIILEIIKNIKVIRILWKSLKRLVNLNETSISFLRSAHLFSICRKGFRVWFPISCGKFSFLGEFLLKLGILIEFESMKVFHGMLEHHVYLVL